MSDAPKVSDITNLLGLLSKSKTPAYFLYALLSLMPVMIGPFYWMECLDSIGFPFTAVIAVCLLVLFSIFSFFAFKSYKKINVSLPQKWAPLLPSNGIREVNNPHLYYPVDPDQYSAIAEEYIKRADVETIFTVANFDPVFFLNTIIEICKRKYPELFSSINAQELTFDTVTNLISTSSNTRAHILEIANQIYPHFNEMSKKAKSGSPVTRILLVDTVGQSAGGWHKRNYAAIPLFKELNGDAQLFVIETNVLMQANVKMLTDHVIFNSYVCLDYYNDSHHLVVVCDGEENPDDGAASMIFKDFYSHFTRNQHSYVSIDTYLKNFNNDSAVVSPA